MGELVKPLTPHEIYEKLRGGQGTSLLDEGRAAARLQWQAEDERAELIRRQAELVQGGWEGTASDSASGAVRPLATNALLGATRLAMAEKLMDRQIGSFHDAANNVRPVPAEPPKPDISDPNWPFVDYEKQVTAYQADAQHNIEVFHGYDTVSAGHETGLGEYATVDDSGGTITVTDGGGTGDVIRVSDQGGPRGGAEPGPSGERRGPGSETAGGPPPVSGPPPVGGPDGQRPPQTTPSDFVPPPVDSPGPLPPGQPVPSGQTPGGPAPGLPVGGFTAGGGPGTTGAPGARGGVYGGPGAGRAPGAGMRGGLLGAGPGVGALTAEEAAAQRAAAGGGAARGTGSGMVGGAPVAAGRGKGDEDDEHRRKVLIEADAEGLFGSDELTAPQVIGDDAYEDD